MCKEFGGDSGMLLLGDEFPIVTSDTPLFLNNLASNVFQYNNPDNIIGEYLGKGFALFQKKFVRSVAPGEYRDDIVNTLFQYNGKIPEIVNVDDDSSTILYLTKGDIGFIP